MESKGLKILTTAVLYYTFIGLGVTLAYLPPGFMQFQRMLDTDLSVLSLVFTSNYVLTLVSSLIFGQLFSCMNRHATITVLFALMAVCIAFLPSKASVVYFFAMNGLGAIGYGGFVTAALVWMIEIWKEDAAPFIQAQHFSFALGCVFPPLIFKPYLAQSDEVSIDLLNSNTSDPLVPYAHDLIVEQARARVAMPCYICGGIVAVGAVLLAFLFCVLNGNKSEAQKETKSSSSASTLDLEEVKASDNEETEKSNVETTKAEDGAAPIACEKTETGPPAQASAIPEVKVKGRILLVTLACIFLGAFQAMEVSFIQYLPTYVHYSFVELGDASGAIILSAYTIAYTCSRLAGIFLSFKLKSEQILCINFLLVAAANLLLIYKGESWNLLMAGTVVAGVGFSTGYPSFFEYFKNIVEVTNSVGSILVVGGGAIAATYIAAIGRLIEQNPMILTYFNLIGLGVCMFVLAIFVVFKKPMMRL